MAFQIEELEILKREAFKFEDLKFSSLKAFKFEDSCSAKCGTICVLFACQFVVKRFPRGQPQTGILQQSYFRPAQAGRGACAASPFKFSEVASLQLSRSLGSRVFLLKFAESGVNSPSA